jgi:hypothetical protein
MEPVDHSPHGCTCVEEWAGLLVLKIAEAPGDFQVSFQFSQ